MEKLDSWINRFRVSSTLKKYCLSCAYKDERKLYEWIRIAMKEKMERDISKEQSVYMPTLKEGKLQ